MNMHAGHSYEFGTFLLDVSEHRLLCRQEVVPLSPKVFETLLVLVEHSGHVLEKDELMKRLWPDSFVEESSLTQNISLLRKALSQGGEQQFIETVPKLGYRFVAPVKEMNSNGGTDERASSKQHTETRAASDDEVIDDEPAGDQRRPPDDRQDNPIASGSETRARRLRRNLILTGGAALLLFVAVGGIYLMHRRKPMPQGAASVSSDGRMRSLAVLPLQPLAGESNDEILGLGVADALIVKLSNFEQFNVRPTSSITKYAGREFDSRSVGRELGVDAVLDGTIQRAGDRVRVTVMLLNIRDGKALWSGKFDERFTDIFALQDSISERVANVLQLQLAQGKQVQPSKRFTQNAEAYSDYAMGLYFWNKRTKEGLTKAIAYFQKATEADHNYALAYAMLADAYSLTVYYGYDVLPSGEALKKAEDADVRALELDDSLAEAHAAMGTIKSYKMDFAGAEQSYMRAIELGPNSAMVRYRYAFDLLAMLEIDNAIREMRRAQELDPLSLPINTTLAACLINVGQYDEAIKYSKLALEVEPQFGLARANLGEAYEWKGMHEEAAAEYMKLTKQQGFRLYGILGLAFVYGRSGRQDEARRLMAEVKGEFKSDEAFLDLPLQIASTYAVLGEKDEAFVWLETAVKSRRVRRFDLRYSRQLNTLKEDSRYEPILRRYEYTKSLASELSKQNLP